MSLIYVVRSSDFKHDMLYVFQRRIMAANTFVELSEN